VRLRPIRLGDALAREIATPPASASPMTPCRRRSGDDAPVVSFNTVIGKEGPQRNADRVRLARWTSRESTIAVLLHGSKRCEVGSNVEKSAGGISPTSMPGIAARSLKYPLISNI